MSVIRIPSEIWAKTYAHLYAGPGEHFAFYLATATTSCGKPVFVVKDVVLIPDSQVDISSTGWSITLEALLAVVNTGVKTNYALIEIHNHGGSRPRFSQMDRRGFDEFIPYVLGSLPGRPYGATVWGDSSIYGEYFLPDGSNGRITSIAIYGDKFDQWVSRDDDDQQPSARYGRQMPWFTKAGQRKLGRSRVGIVGNGGTGGPLAQNLVYLGLRDFVVVDDDSSDDTSMNRLITATAADVDTPKVILARRLIKAVAPDARVHAIHKKLQSSKALDTLKGVDVLFGCVDNDGARLILNELAVAYHIPYFDLGAGIDADAGHVKTAGGRLAVVLPGGPCLNCMGQIDPDEARYVLASEEQQEVMRRRGYVTGMNVISASVVTLNAALAAAAGSELAVYVSGLRRVHPLSEIDLLGIGRPVKSQWMTPIHVAKKSGCPVCELARTGDDAGIEQRYFPGT